MRCRDLSALLGSRICHDLISPLGAIGNGVELLSLSGVRADSELGLISQSVESANTKIRFFRIAFGSATEDQLVSAAEARGILQDVSVDNRLKFIWKPKADLPRHEVKLAFLLLLCFESALPWGGRIVVDRIDDTWTLHGTAERTKIDPDLWGLLVDPGAEAKVTAAFVQFALVSAAAELADRKLTTQLTETEIRIAF